MKNLARSFHILGIFLILAVASTLQAQTPQSPFPISGPTTINAPGYYRLTGNIVSTATSGDIITVHSHNVTIDLNTFFIVGPKNPANTVIGISANEFGNITIKNGSIAFCLIGIQLTGNNTPGSLNINQMVDKMRISNCYEYGVYFPTTSPGSVVSNCLFSQIGGSTAGTSFGIAVYANIEPGLLIKDNIINGVTGPNGSASGSYGIVRGISVRNALSDSNVGVDGGKYQNNLTINVTTPFIPGVDAGGNN